MYKIYIFVIFLGDTIVIILILNVLIFCVIFWLLTWFAEYFYTIKQQLTKKQFYECGFKSISELNIQINLGFFMVAVFLILYETEFNFLFPLLFNYSTFSLLEFILILIFISLILLSLLYDFVKNSLDYSLE